MKRKNWKKGIAMFLCATLLASAVTSCSGSGSNSDNSNGSDGADPGKKYSFTFTIHDPATSAKTAYYESLADATREATNGAVDITVFPGGTLVASTDVAEGILTGAADIGWLYTGFFAGQFPLTDVVSMPMMYKDSIQATNVLNDLYEQSPELQAELENYKILGMYCNPVNYIFTKGKAVNSVSDLHGMNIRAAAGVATDMTLAWGGEPITMGPGDMYEALEKGVIDGYLLEWTATKSFNLGEVIDYCTEVPVYCGIFLTVMNKDSWNSLPKEYQEIVDEIWCRDASLELAQLNIDDGDIGRETAIAEQNVTIIEPDEATLAEFQAAADNYVDEWIAKNSTADFDAQAYVDLAASIAEQYE